MQRGFTLVELLVVVALVALLSSVVLFDGGSARERHEANGAYGILDTSLSQAATLSLSQQSSEVGTSSTHWVLNGATNLVQIYQDTPSGTLGVYDATSDILREEYVLDESVELEVCQSAGSNCTTLNQFVVSRSPNRAEVALRNNDATSTILYGRVLVNEQAVDYVINALGVIEKQQ